MSKEVLSEEDQLQILYIDLNKACTVSDNDKVNNIANKILKKYPNEFKAFHCKIISMMNLENFEASLKLLNEHSDFAKELLFEKSYCEYRLNRLKEALTTIESANENDMRIQELLGQILYKQEHYEEALDKYKFLMRNAPDAYEEDRIVNMTASVTAMNQWCKSKKEFPNVPENMFEICLNKACHLAAMGRYDEAVQKLKEAEVMCLQTFEGEHDVTAAEIDEELCVIKVQEGFCLQKMGKHQEASTIYHDILKKRCGDSHVLAVAANNVVCINKDQNIFDSRKKMKMTTGDAVRQKLISRQHQEIIVNNLLFQYYSNQGDGVKKEADVMIDKWPLCVRAALVKVAQLVKDKQGIQAIKYLETYLDVIEKSDIDEEDLVRVQLTLAQLHLSQGSVSQCNNILGDLPIGYRHRMGVLGTRVSLCLMNVEVQSALDCLDQAMDWHKSEASVLKKASEKEARMRHYDTLLKIAANLAMRQKLPEKGAKYYELLMHRSPGDQSVLASLIAAYSRFDKSQAEKYISLLKDEKQLPEVDVDSLESAFIFGVKHMKKLLKGESTPTKSDTGASPAVTGHDLRKRKKKVGKKPKNCDPNKIPDPERWLPKRERAHYRGRKRDKRANQFRGPQGAVSSGAVDNLDASKKVSAPATPSADPIKKATATGATVTTAPPTNKPKTGASASNSKKNKPKKKGGKW